MTFSRSSILILGTMLAWGCATGRHWPDEQEMAEFESAGPVLPELDQDAILRVLRAPTAYRVQTGDVLEIQAPAVLLAAGNGNTTGTATSLHVDRVDGEGRIELPSIGAVDVRDRTLLQIEEAITSAAHPRYLRQRPSVVVRVTDYQRLPVTVMGAVERPGRLELRHDELTLYGALSAAGGILKGNNLVVGARLIRVRRTEDTLLTDVVLPVKGLNVPVADVELEGGEIIEVERYEPDTFTVVGLVREPGAFEYPPEVTYNLMQALAVAGGVDMTANPPYATVFRKRADGIVLPATFEIRGNGLTQSSGLAIKPGDVIVVDHTFASWTRSLMSQVLRIQFGFYVDEQSGR
jgi:polysaccharide export outer membrane protein